MTAEHQILAASDRTGVLDADQFRAIFRQHPAGVAVVTLVAEDGRPVGFTATSVISVSADPPLVAFSINTTSSS